MECFPGNLEEFAGNLHYFYRLFITRLGIALEVLEAGIRKAVPKRARHHFVFCSRVQIEVDRAENSAAPITIPSAPATDQTYAVAAEPTAPVEACKQLGPQAFDEKAPKDQ